MVVPAEVQIFTDGMVTHTKANPQTWNDVCVVTKYVPACPKTPRQDLVYRYPFSSLQRELPMDVTYDVPLIYLHHKQTFLSTSLGHRTHLFSIFEGHINR